MQTPLSPAAQLLDLSLFELDATPPTPYLAAVSGGPDSLVLLLATAELARHGRIALECCYIDHGVREGAGEREAAYVQTLCAQLGVPFHMRRLPPIQEAPNIGSLEGKLRYLRYAMLAQLARERGAAAILLGHTKDDLVETYLMNLVRGGGLRAATFHPKAKREGIVFVRPLWHRTRAEILHILRMAKIEALEDETNRDLRFTRNRVRHVLLPLLETQFNPNVRDALFTSAILSAEAYKLVRRRAFALFLAAQRRARDLPRALHVGTLKRASELLRKEAVALWLEKSYGRRLLRSRTVYEAVDKLLYAPSARFVVLSGQYVVARAGEELATCQVERELTNDPTKLRLAVSEALARDYFENHKDLLLAKIDTPIALRVSETAPSQQGRVYCAVVRGLDGRSALIELVVSADDTAPAVLPMYLGNRCYGDRIAGRIRLKDFLISEKVPFYLRDFLIFARDSAGHPVGIVGHPQWDERLRSFASIAAGWCWRWRFISASE